MKTILKITVILVIVVVFVGTIVYLYKKSQAEPVVFETTTAFKTDIIRKRRLKSHQRFPELSKKFLLSPAMW